MTTQEDEIYNNSQICQVCRGNLDTDKIRDCSTITGKFRSDSHSKCSKYLDIPKKLPIIFHNLERL